MEGYERGGRVGTRPRYGGGGGGEDPEGVCPPPPTKKLPIMALIIQLDSGHPAPSSLGRWGQVEYHCP